MLDRASGSFTPSSQASGLTECSRGRSGGDTPGPTPHRHGTPDGVRERPGGSSAFPHRLRGAGLRGRGSGGVRRCAPRPPATVRHPSGMKTRRATNCRAPFGLRRPSGSGNGAFDRAKLCLTPRPRRAQRSELLRVLRGLGVRLHPIGTFSRARKRCRRSAAAGGRIAFAADVDSSRVVSQFCVT